MELRILGPFEVRDASGTEVKVPAGRERALLAVLVLSRGEVVSIDAIVDALWDERPPSTAPKAVQGYVSHLRRVLGVAGSDNGALVTQPPGYFLRLDGIQVDAVRFESLAAESWRTLQDDPDAALEMFDEALALWRGPALGEFAYASFAQREIHRLEELRLETTEGRLEAILELGRHGAVVAELEQRVDEHPFRERLRRLLMLALYRSGRQAEALDVYRKGRRLLADELGLEPGTELQRLERSILAQDPELDEREQPRRMSGVRQPKMSHPPRARLRLIAGSAVLLAVAAGALTTGLLLVSDETPAPVIAAPPAIVVVDPDTNRVIASISVGSRPVAVAANDGAIWVGDARDGTITRIDPTTTSVVKTIGIGAPVVDLATGAGGVWAATGGFGEVVLIDPELGAVANRIPLGEPGSPIVPSVSAVGVGDGRVWAGTNEGLVRIDPSSGELVGTVDLGRRSAVLQIAMGGGAVWATTIDGRVKRVETSSARQTAEFYAGSFVNGIAVGDDAVWVGGGDEGQIWKLDPVTAVARFSSRPRPGAGGVAFGEGALWVTSYRDGGLVRLSPETGEVEARIPTGGPAEDVVVHAGLVWIPVQGPP